MQITIFSKKRTTADGRKFYAYLSTLTRKDGTEVVVSVRFKEECGAPKPEDCPMIIEVEQKTANIAQHSYVREDTGETAISYTLWVTKWEKVGEYEDTSLQDFLGT